MRKFFELMPDAGLKGYSYVDNYYLGGFDRLSIIQAKRCNQDELSRVKICIEDTNLQLADFMGGVIDWPTLSDKFFNLIKDIIFSDVQVLDLPLFSQATGGEIKGYRLLNILSLVDCVDKSRSLVTPGIRGEDIITELYIHSNLVPDDVNIFRIPDCLDGIIVSEEFLARIRGKGLKGVVMSEVS
ncbi:hypothetical protein QT397_11340 [Microbulbifer sp. MKSA007]|uniref:hypothetical protein n=1 Tax=Microbulbifer sp. ZKSA004 TaxID=3243389 RepID=UPI002B2B5340|nr:hypothetical protein QT397_11340 [Microbulbifer sp. MKSA007]